MTHSGINDGHQCIIYLLRHGEPDLPAGGKRYIGRTDLPLSSAGREQGRRLQQFFSQINLTRIFCSHLKRSEQTARIISQGHPVQCSVVPEMGEINMGAWEGLTFEAVRHSDPRGFEQRGQDPANYQPSGGESFQQLQNRVIAVFQQIASSAKGAIVIVGHAGVNRVLLCHLLEMPLNNLFRIGQDYAAMTVIHKLGPEYRIDVLNCKI